jgi:hypothetical protein
MSLTTIAAQSNASDSQNAAASLLEQLLSPPAPLRNSSADGSIEAELADRKASWFSIAGIDANIGQQWKFAVDRSSATEAPLALDSFQRFSATFVDPVQNRQALMQSINGFTNGLIAASASQRNDGITINQNATADGNRQIGQWLATAARYVDNVQISASVPLESSFVMQAPTETIQAAINSREVTEHLEKNSESASLLAQLLGWQRTGLLPSAADLQKMASDNVGAITSGIERWALQNVSLSSSSQALANTESQEQMLQWHWSVTANNSQYNSNSVADNEANFSANLRRLFGMNDYY